jgi:4-hydroxy-2-oxoheptanedioate aldolase
VSSVRERMRAGERLLGMFVQSRDPATSEFLGRLGLDVLCVEGEHPGIGVETMQAIVALAALAPVPALLRVAGNEQIAIAAALDAGACGVIVPRVETPEQAAGAVQSARYPPGGARGLGPGRASGWGVGIAEYLRRANRELLLAIQVETAAAVNRLEELLSVPDVDMIFVGPGDLGCSLGIGDPGSAELRALVGSVLQRAGAAGCPRGVFAATPADARAWQQEGVELVILGSDMMWLRQGVSDALTHLRNDSIGDQR